MKAIIRLGRRDRPRWQVVGSGAPSTLSMASRRPAGDPCHSCPKRGHGNCVIAEGDPDHRINGIPVAYAGTRPPCGATLIATLQTCGKS